MSFILAAGWLLQQPQALLAHINLFKAERRKVPVVEKVSFHILTYKEGESLLEVLLWVSLTRNVSGDRLLRHIATTDCVISIPHLCYTVITGMFQWSLQLVSHCHPNTVLHGPLEHCHMSIPELCHFATQELCHITTSEMCYIIMWPQQDPVAFTPQLCTLLPLAARKLGTLVTGILGPLVGGKLS